MLCATNTSGLVLCKRTIRGIAPIDSPSTNSICAIPQVGKRRQEFLTMGADRILRSHGPEIDHVRIVAVHDDPCLRKIVGEERFRPAGRSTFCSPCGLSIAREAVNKYNAEFADQPRKAHMRRVSLNRCIDLVGIHYPRT